jgi:hypothetical protein
MIVRSPVDTAVLSVTVLWYGGVVSRDVFVTTALGERGLEYMGSPTPRLCWQLQLHIVRYPPISGNPRAGFGVEVSCPETWLLRPHSAVRA